MFTTTLKNRMTRVLMIAALPVGLSLVLAGNSIAKLAPCVNFLPGTCNAVSSDSVADDDGPGLGGGYSPSDSGETALDDGPGLGGGYGPSSSISFVTSDGPGGSTPYIID